MGWKLLTIKLVVLAVGLYFARDAFTTQKEILSLRLNQTLNPSAAGAAILASKQAQFKRSAIIAACCLIPLILYSIISSMFWLALLAVAGLLISRYMK